MKIHESEEIHVFSRELESFEVNMKSATVVLKMTGALVSGNSIPETESECVL